MNNDARKLIEAAQIAMFKVEELLPLEDELRQRLYSLRLQYGLIAINLITKNIPYTKE